MKKRFVPLALVVVVMTVLAITGWIQAAQFPGKGKTLTIIVPYPPGGASDVIARLLAPSLEDNFGTPVQVVNKPGGGGQVGMTSLVLSKPDGYTMAISSVFAAITPYLDPERKAVYTRKDLQPMANFLVDPIVVVVRDQSPYKSMKDFIDAVRGNPYKVKVAGATFLTGYHLFLLDVQQKLGAKFAIVNFDGIVPGRNALLGGHVDASVNGVSEVMAQLQSGQLRALGITGRRGSRFFPDIKTMESQGFNLYMESASGFSLPGATPKEIVQMHAGAIKKALDSESFQKKMVDLGMETRFMGPEEFAAFWDEIETTIRPLLAVARKQQ